MSPRIKPHRAVPSRTANAHLRFNAIAQSVFRHQAQAFGAIPHSRPSPAVTAFTPWKMAIYKTIPPVAAVSDASSDTPTADLSYFAGLQGQPDDGQFPLDDECATSDAAFTTAFPLPDWDILPPELAPIGMDQASDFGPSAAPDWHSNMTLQPATSISSFDLHLRSHCATNVDSGISAPSSSAGDAKSGTSFVVSTARAQAIEPFKNIIKDLYITQNLALRDVKRIMEADYDFRETDKVYKNAFARWSFNKYQSLRQRRTPMASGQPLSGRRRRASPARTHPRMPDITRQLLHVSLNARSIEIISRATTQFLSTLCADNGRVLSGRIRLDDMLADTGLLEYRIIVAKRAFRDGNEAEAWDLVNKAFLDIEESIRCLDCRSFMELCFRVPNALLESKLYDLAACFIRHTRGMALARNLGSHHPVTVIMTAAFHLLGGPYASGELLLVAMAQCSADAARRISALHGGVSADDLSSWCHFNVTPTQAEIRVIADQLGASGGHVGSWVSLEGLDNFLFLQEKSGVYIEQYPELAMRDMARLLRVIQGAGCDYGDIFRFISRCVGLAFV
ncbi:hypothetical protein GGTG_10568 [Gaeumannomyces tritici R3-111a-1]|uniref:Clr5 domain-containing protein n=1 Tax=Gaeumannomyces tritici (strain R3-111a-1) TaxID=644352 RepID=J3PAP3_GAET3|nr:hypothetical protein GGTG_10568 [Gaeumannomyces tritici R3-111a-1]EJT71309.1 hypothetical protein GGTG_10568 [Gaeumannomyces tritici R3-111a-1]